MSSWAAFDLNHKTGLWRELTKTVFHDMLSCWAAFVDSKMSTTDQLSPLPVNSAFYPSGV